jgi:hypothetical protein
MSTPWHGPRVVVVAVAALCACACAGAVDSGHRSAAIADLLWLPPDATIRDDVARPVRVENGRSVYIDGSASVAFDVEAEPDELTTRIVERVSSPGWRPRSTQYLNPQLPTSFRGGWTVHGGGVMSDDLATGRQFEPYRRWHGEWEDRSGNIIVYVLGGQGTHIRGAASYVPRALVDTTRRRLGR